MKTTRLDRRTAVGLATAATLLPGAALAATKANASAVPAAQSIEAQIHDLMATKLITELRARYGWHAARGDFEGIVGLFAPEGIFETAVADGTRHRLTGQAEIRAFLLGNMVPGMVFPLIHNDIVVVQGDTAYGSCAMETRSADGKLAFSGYYHDKARIVDGQWRFTQRLYFTYVPRFERSGMDMDWQPETGLAAIHDRKKGQLY